MYDDWCEPEARRETPGDSHQKKATKGLNNYRSYVRTRIVCGFYSVSYTKKQASKPFGFVSFCRRTPRGCVS